MEQTSRLLLLLGLLCLGISRAAPTAQIRTLAPSDEPEASGAPVDGPPSTEVAEVGTDDVAANSTYTADNVDGNSTKCVHPDKRGYLLWTGYKPEFNNQMITLAETILLNKALNNIGRGRVLVLTGFMELRDPGVGVNSSDGLDYVIHPEDHELHRVSYALDVPQTMANLGIAEGDYIDLKDFRQLCHSKMTVEAHSFIHDWDEPNRLPPTGSIEETRTDYQIQEKVFPFPNPQDHPIPEIQGITFPEARIVVHDPTALIHIKKDLPHPEDVKLLVMDSLFYSATNFNPSYAPRRGFDYFDTVGKYVFSHAVKKVMRDFRVKAFGSETQQYIAVHWRRGFHVSKAGDDNRDSADVSYDFQAVADLAKRKSENACPGCPIYIASNNISQTDIDEITAYMGTGQVVVSMMINPPDIELNTLSRAEMAICVQARAFVPSKTSTWSANVQAMRGQSISGPPPGKAAFAAVMEAHPLRPGVIPFSLETSQTTGQQGKEQGKAGHKTQQSGDHADGTRPNESKPDGDHHHGGARAGR